MMWAGSPEGQPIPNTSLLHLQVIHTVHKFNTPHRSRAAALKMGTSGDFTFLQRHSEPRTKCQQHPETKLTQELRPDPSVGHTEHSWTLQHFHMETLTGRKGNQQQMMALKSQVCVQMDLGKPHSAPPFCCSETLRRLREGNKTLQMKSSHRAAAEQHHKPEHAEPPATLIPPLNKHNNFILITVTVKDSDRATFKWLNRCKSEMVYKMIFGICQVLSAFLRKPLIARTQKQNMLMDS